MVPPRKLGSGGTESDSNKITDLRLALEHQQAGVFIVRRRADGQFAYELMEGKLAAHAGFSGQSLIGKSPHEAFGREMGDFLVAHYENAFKGQKVRFELGYMDFWSLTVLEPVTKDGAVVEMIGTITDITELKKTEHRFDMVLRHTRATVFNQDKDLRFTWMRHFEPNLEGREFIGKKDGEVFSPETTEILKPFKEKVLHSGKSVRFEQEFTPRGERMFFDLTIEPTVGTNGEIDGIAGTSLNITERKLADFKAAQQQKMLALGTLAGGIAHDFNNSLHVIMALTELTLMKLPEDSPETATLHRVLDKCERAAAVVKQITAFSGRGRQSHRLVSLGKILGEVLVMMRASLPSTIRVERKSDAVNDGVFGDESELAQVIMNLCVNAADAMKEGGALEIGLSEVLVTAEKRVKGVNLPPGPYVTLTLKDTGAGIPVDVLPRIFEPFFTTKNFNQGSGMGLAIVHGIVTSMRGQVTVESAVGEGSRFTLYFPAAQAVAADKARLPKRDSRADNSGKHVLVVDDDESVVSVVKMQLEHLGYRVTGYTESLSALEAFRSSPRDFDALVLDQTMPELAGMDLAKAALKVRPDLPVLLMTGNYDWVNREEALTIGIRLILQKPLGMESLKASLQLILQPVFEENA